jgi:hypothetical protein
VLQGMNNEEKTLARTNTDGTHMKVSQSTGIVVTEIRMHQNLKNRMCVVFIFTVAGSKPEVVKKENISKSPNHGQGRYMEVLDVREDERAVVLACDSVRDIYHFI